MAAVDSRVNRFDTRSLTTSDIQNHADYNASGFSLSGGYSSGGTGKASDGSKQAATPNSAGGINGAAAGIGSASGHASGTTTSGISGIAGNTQARTGDASGGVANTFDADKVQKEIGAQLQITSTFGRQASQAIGDYAASQMKQADALRAQASAEPDEAKRTQLNAQADQLEADWGANGTMRLLAHTVVGGLTGGLAGAAGAAAGTASAPLVADALKNAGITGALASSLTAIASTAAGAVAGGVAGAGTALNEVANNYLKHAAIQRLQDKLQACGSDKTCRDQAIDDAARTSIANDIGLLNCKTTNNCEALKNDFRQGYASIVGLLDAGVPAQEVGQILNLETNAQTIIRNGLDQRQCTTQACIDQSNYLVGIGKGLSKVTPAGLAAGAGVMAYELTTSILNQGLTDTAIAVARGITDLPADLSNRLSSSDPQVRGEALVDALSIGSVAAAVTTKLAQGGYAAAIKQADILGITKSGVDEAAEAAAARIANNASRDGGISDPSRPMSASGPWKSVSELTPDQANRLVESALQGARITGTISADAANAQTLAKNPSYSPSYMPGTNIVEFATTETTAFVRLSGGASYPTANWMMKASDIAGLTPEQIAAKFALPAVPISIGDVTIPVGTKLQASIANGILLGNNPGGGGVQFYIPLERGKLPSGWFGETRPLR